MDEAFRQQLEAKDYAHQEALSRLQQDKQEEIDAANEKVHIGPHFGRNYMVRTVICPASVIFVSIVGIFRYTVGSPSPRVSVDSLGTSSTSSSCFTVWLHYDSSPKC